MLQSIGVTHCKVLADGDFSLLCTPSIPAVLWNRICISFCAPVPVTPSYSAKYNAANKMQATLLREPELLPVSRIPDVVAAASVMFGDSGTSTVADEQAQAPAVPRLREWNCNLVLAAMLCDGEPSETQCSNVYMLEVTNNTT